MKQASLEKGEKYLFEDLNVPQPGKDASPVFITGVGRSGTHFLAELLNQSDSIDAYHLDDVGNSVGDSFLMYSKWNGLEMDLQPFYSSRDYLINISIENKSRFIESNPYLAFSISDLAAYYPNALFISVIRDHRKVVLSHLNKGWYENFVPDRVDMSKPPFYDYRYKRANHFFGRIFPHHKEEYGDWCQLTSVGKIAWMWQTINNSILDTFKELDNSRFRVISIDEFDYNAYTDCMAFLNQKDAVTNYVFDSIRKSKPGKSKNIKHSSWGELEEKEYLDQISKFPGYAELLTNEK